MCSAPRTRLAPHPARNGLTFQRKALPGLQVFLFLLGLNFPAPPLGPFLLPPIPAPQWKGWRSQCPREGSRSGGEVVCVLPWLKHCAIWQSEGAFAGCQEGGDKERKSRLSSSSGSSRGGGSQAGPHLLAGCRGKGRHRGPSSPSSPRQSKQDRWAWAWRD